MTGVQIGVLAVVVLAFALGWWTARASAREAAQEAAPDPRERALMAVDAALAMWRLERGRLSPATRRALVTAAGRVQALEPPDPDRAAAASTLSAALTDAALAGVTAGEPGAVLLAARGVLGHSPAAGTGVVLRSVRFLKALAADPAVPRPLRWLLLFAALPIPGPVDEFAGALALFLLRRMRPGIVARHWRESA